MSIRTDQKVPKSRVNRRFLAARGGYRRLLSIGVSALLSISTFLTVLPQTETIVYADGDKTITGLCTGAIGDPTPGDTAGLTGWKGSYVYYGKDGENAMKYRVLDTAATEFNTNTTMLLDCDSTLLNMAHGPNTIPSGYRYNWADSNIKTWLNGDDFYGNTNVFTAQEKAAIAGSTKASAASGDGSGWSALGYAQLAGEHIFLLDAKEATRSSYGYADTSNNSETRMKINDWWLRSPNSHEDSRASFVSTTGHISTDSVYSSYGVSPAFNLNLSSVIFSSVIPGDMGDPGTEYKLTIADSNMGITTGTITRSGTTITVPYTITGEKSGNATQVSVLLTDRAYTAGTAATSGYTYKKLNVTTWGTSGTGTFTIPDSYADKTCGTDYYAYILAEDVNTGKATDYASTPATITIPDLPQVATPTFSPAAGTYTEAQNVAISCDTDGATIHYTMDGTEPTATSTTYDGPINISETTTIKAIAIKDGMTYSEVATAKYTINHPVSEKTYTVTVIADEKNGGTASADIKSGKSGTKVTIAAAAQKDYEFKEWKVLSGGVALADPKQAITTFTIGSSNVEVKAVFEKKAAPGPIQKDISKATVSGIKNKTYTGKALKQSPVVKLDGKTLKVDIDYTLSYKNNKNAGTAKVTITGKGDYTGSVTKSFKIKQAANKLNVKAKKATYSASYSKNKNKTIGGTRIYKFTNKKKTKGRIKYTLSSVKKDGKKVTKGFSVSKSSGKLTIKKGVAKGTYKITVKVTAGDKNYKTVKKNVKFNLKIK